MKRAFLLSMLCRKCYNIPCKYSAVREQRGRVRLGADGWKRIRKREEQQ